jgi:hypothetical protein
VALIEAYFDESGSHGGSPVLCVAGYVFEKEKCEQLDLEWRQVLKEFLIPYFHMVDCTHGKRPFAHLDLNERTACKKEMISIIRKYMSFGTAVAVNESNYNSWVPSTLTNLIENAYSFCCWMCLIAIKGWAKENNCTDDISYFFEAGHKHQSTTEAVMSRISNNPKLRNDYQFSTHAFVRKEKSTPAQAADLFAWLQAAQFKRWLLGNNAMRKDLAALVRDRNHRLLYGSHEMLSGLIDYFRTVAINRYMMTPTQGPIMPISARVRGGFAPMWNWTVSSLLLPRVGS